jgi:flagellar L-ring protein precursor FlgH
VGAADVSSSLWSDEANSLFSDHKARRVGDLITVLISERSYASNNAQTSTGKGAGLTVAEGVGWLSFLPETGFSSNVKSTGRNSTSRSGNLVARMTARITEVLPDGNLKIEGTQAVVINRERQDIVITGIVRPEDIGADNTVLSTYIAGAEIKYEGSLNSEQRKGLLSYLGRFFDGILDFLF